MRILIADDHDLLRDTLMLFFAQENGINAVAVADFPSAMDVLVSDPAFALVLLDYSMPGMNGLEGLRRVLDLRGPRVALMSGTAARPVAEAALGMGAAGFLPKSLPARQLVSAVRLMAAGGRFIPDDLAATDARVIDPAETLSAREVQVLQEVARGATDAEIAAIMGLREPTVRVHLRTLLRKTGAADRAGLPAAARAAGMI